MPEAPPERGVIELAMAWLLGANWSTSLSGFISVVAWLIYENPTLIHWIPEPLQRVIWSVSQYVFIGGIGALAALAKSHNVTGGSVQQTYNGKLVDLGSQDMVDATVRATLRSGETVPDAVQKAALS